MLGPYPYRIVPPKTHLSVGERELWERYVAKFPDMFEQVWFDVELGVPRNYDELRPEQYARHHRYLGGYKIDVLCEKDGVKTIVEVKRQATTKALGEIWCYDDLYKRFVDTISPVKNLIVTDEEMPHIREICEKAGVGLVVI